MATVAQQVSQGQNAAANAAACEGAGCPGGSAASTQGAASGPGSTTSGYSSANGKVDTCAQGPANSVACMTLSVADRSSQCSDLAPDANFTCEQQAAFGKCNSDFIFQNGYCLKSCNRCGSNCTDQAPPNGQCDSNQCDSAEYLSQPYCLATCKRCYSGK
ncbi:hypothetical protein H632_c1273p1 [Helicosporidium sp. ATCC 50920]|nr:hypothetical protein H632_c1273p1 [Helicosporidium sp. ATCC 50920]|eukprot:KDD74498.1 hypothetical protein H632_c1273p1 [Helicosporidium sp. ATCC 50920]